MIKMKAVRWIFPLALCFMCVSSNDDRCYEDFYEDPNFCDSQTLVAPLGSSVLLPCSVTSGSLNWVSWAHNPNEVFINLSSQGRVKFVDPKNGRVKAFPNQSLSGNFSIRIDGVEDKDFGCYRCKTQGNYCLQLKLLPEAETLSKEMWLLIFICAGVAALALLFVFTYLIISKRKQINISNPAPAGIVGIEVLSGASAPPLEIGPPVQEQRRGVDNSVYENDDQAPDNHHHGAPTRNHSGLPEAQPYYLDTTQPTQSGLYPNLNQFNFERVESQRTRLRFHRDLMNRLRQASFSRHYYVNQRELSNQQAKSTPGKNPQRDAGKKKAKDDSEYKNPIYNSGTDQLNQL